MGTMEASYCLCGQPYDPNIFMIQCDICKDWFHGSCCNFEEHLAIEIDKYHCPRCTPVCGPSLYKPYRNGHRHDYWDENATAKPVQTGTEIFIQELCARHFASDAEVVTRMRGQQLTETLLTQKGFDNPILIETKDGLDMTLPPDNFSLYDVESYIGGDFDLDVIDVSRQRDMKMKLKDFVAYFNTYNRTRIFNVVSLEFSQTGMSRMVEAPLIARKLDWANCVWPRDYPIHKPQVQKYCLMSTKDSYTDFHIDFGGTSVWYHVLRGEKIFYFIRPTKANLTLYQQWMTSSNQSETFYGDQVDQCFKCTLQKGQTMLIPTGWIHAVLTPIDSLVFGGNFLHSLNIPMQLQVYGMEKKIKTVEKFMYPYFQTIHWFAVQKFLIQITQLNMDASKCPTSLLLALKTIVASLKQWNTEKDFNGTLREQIPVGINAPKLFKDISKEIRIAERYLNTLNPPKPERESKRKRKKPVNKDFVDYSTNKSSLEFLTIDHTAIRPFQKPAAPLKLTLPKPAMYPYERTALSVNEQDIINATFEDGWNTNVIRPVETTVVHRGGAVLKIKLGAKDMVPAVEHQLQVIGNISKSIYDFHDDSEREEDCFNLSIDETTPKSRRKSEGIKVRLPKIKVDVAAAETGPESPKNGIESLLKASALTNKFIHDTGGRTSPSTREAIAGMLSISQTYVPPKTKNKKYRPISDTISDEETNDVHQDEEYVYPSLDNSDDDDVHVFKTRGRSKQDESWNPKARVGPLLPKMNRPAREGVKKQAVEKVLEAAAAKRAAESSRDKSPKRQYKRKKTKLRPREIKLQQPVPSTSSSTSSGSLTVASTSSPQVPSGSTPKPRKGMKTVKQRLGKILKIHKMIH